MPVVWLHAVVALHRLERSTQSIFCDCECLHVAGFAPLAPAKLKKVIDNVEESKRLLAAGK